MDPLERLNRLPEDEAVRELAACCGSRRWAAEMAAARPFAGREDLFAAAGRIWRSLAPGDWLEAFAAHPRIGEREPGGAAPAGARARRWSAAEQAGTADADREVLAALVRGNRVYEDRFGHVFLISASGKSAAEMLAALERRLRHEPEEELRIAAGEQERITRLRLVKLLEG